MFNRVYREVILHIKYHLEVSLCRAEFKHWDKVAPKDYIAATVAKLWLVTLLIYEINFKTFVCYYTPNYVKLETIRLKFQKFLCFRVG